MDKERELFERWACEDVNDVELRRLICLRSGAFGEYEIDSVEDKWEAWQARAKLSQWQPIETIPKDGTEVIARYGRQGNVKKLVFYNTVHNFWSSKGEAVLGLMENATEWMSIPEPPK